MSAAASKILMQEIFESAGNPDPTARDRAMFAAALADDAKWVVTG
ncbi:MAG: ketosteroid isomerase, partial [Ramlibacter sp.]|nr:ketosteroid isomerase [Ramlibacter sp.]